jgi:hypothetical protein
MLLVRTVGWLLPIMALGPTAAPVLAWQPSELFAPCTGNCGVAIYAGNYAETPMGEALVTSPQLPFFWEYNTNDHLVATAVSRVAGSFWRGRFTLEPEFGIGQRFGRQSATELWGALFFRYHGFPWDKWIVTTLAVSTGMNWASEVTGVEDEKANDGQGDHWMHFFAPEVTFAAPSHSNVQLFFRFHHRSGVFGLLNDNGGGAQYGTIGVRVLF